MTLPRSIWSKALRSQLVRCHLSRPSAQNPEACYSPTSRRLYSRSVSEEQSAAGRDPEITPESAPQPERLSKLLRNELPASSRMKREVSMRSPEKLKENELLMAIAQGDSKSDGSRSKLGIKPKALRMEMQWLKDPRALADRVGRLLQAGDPASAAVLVRQAHKERMPTTVAWNRLMMYCMERGHWKPAFKFFNDMKKRGGKPNAVTFTILLNGFRHAVAPTSKRSEILSTAEAVYRSIFASNSPVEPSIIHANAMLSVCQWHGDMDSLWRIAGELPEEGAMSPDMTTYSIIFGALQHTARADIEKIDASKTDEIFERKTQMVNDGKRIWADVLHRWTQDQMPLDNNVVGAMASLLLDGTTDSSYYDVLALYHQTMGIPILAARPPENSKLASRSRYLIKSQARESVAEDDVPFVDEHNEPVKTRNQRTTEDSEALAMEEEEENFDSLFDPLVPGNDSLSFVQPGNKDLTMIVDACSHMTQATAAGFAYWNQLTIEQTPYRIDPDTHSSMVYLRFLRYSRSSKRAVQVLRDQVLPLNQATGKLFHVAVSVCRRDKNNRSVLTHANELLGLMSNALILPDPRALEGYLQLVQSLSEQPQILHHMKDLNMDEGPEVNNLQTLGKKLQVNLRLSALATLRPHIAQLHEALERGSPARKGRWDALHRGDEHVFGQVAVKIMNWTRLLIDDALQAHFTQFIPKKERKILESESKQLRKYSDKEVIQKFTGFIVHPSTKQRHEFKERQRVLSDSSKPTEPIGEKLEEERRGAQEAEPSLTSRESEL